MDRRKFLQTVSAVAVGTTALAGCGSPGPGAENGTDGVDEPLVDTEPEAGDGIDAGTETEAGMGAETETEAGMGAETETEAGMGAETETEAGMAGTTTAGVPDLDEMLGETPEGIEVSNTELTRDFEQIQVTGTVENTGDQTFDEVEVAVTLLDDNDELIGQFFHDTEEAEVESLEPGAQWDFTVDFPAEDAEDAARYRIDVDTTIDEVIDIDLGDDTATGTDTTAG